MKCAYDKSIHSIAKETYFVSKYDPAAYLNIYHTGGGWLAPKLANKADGNKAVLFLNLSKLEIHKGSKTEQDAVRYITDILKDTIKRIEAFTESYMNENISE